MAHFDAIVEKIKTIVVSENDVLAFQFTDVRGFRAFMGLSGEERRRFLSPLATSFPDTKFFVMAPGIEIITINKEVAEATDGIHPIETE